MYSIPHTTILTLTPTPSPESPWTLSPLQIPSPSLLYHCALPHPYHREGTIYSLLHCNFKAAWSRLYWLQEYPNPRMEATRLHGVRCLQATPGEIRSILAYSNMLFTTRKDHNIRIWNTASDNFKSKKVSSISKKKKAHFPYFQKPTKT